MLGLPTKIKIFIQENYKGIGNKELTALINERFNSNYKLSQVIHYKRKHHLNSGLTGRFEKGCVPPNKGKKGYINPGAIPTQFKKGHKPENTHPIGTIIKRRDGNYIKVNDLPGPHNIAKRWIPLSKYVYEKEYGLVEDGNVFLHLDGDPFNDKLENLKVISKRELLVLNRKKLIFNNPALTSEGVLLAKTIVKIEERIKDAEKK